MALVSVIIPVYKDDERLPCCLKALDEQTYPKNKFEVILVDNDPYENLNIMIDHSLDLYVIKEIKPGSYAARNAGIINAKGKILAFTDSDGIPGSNWIEMGVNTLLQEKNNKIIVAGRVQLIYKDENRLSLAECYEKYFGFPHQRSGNNTLSGMVAGNVFINKQTFAEIGLFNSDLLSGGDTELSYRAIKNNYNIRYNSDCVVYHPAKYQLSDLLKKRRRIFGGKVFRRIKVDGGKKIPSLAVILFKQSKRYLRELFDASFSLKTENFRDRNKLIVSLVLILISLYYESVVILIANKMRRR